MFKLLLIALLLSAGVGAESSVTEKTTEVFPPRLAGTWKADSNMIERLGPKSSVLASCDSLTFTAEKTWKDMTPAFVDSRHADAPIHIGGVTINGNADALFILRGRVGLLEIGTTPGGGGADRIQWESLHMILGVDPTHDMLVVGHSIYKRQL